MFKELLTEFPLTRKNIATISVTIDGVCDHTVGIADEELHRPYEVLIDNAGLIHPSRRR
jgi:hypothetical protein